MTIPWRIEADGAPVVTLPCKHDALIQLSWIASNGYVGRLQCTEQDCRRVADMVVLEGWHDSRAAGT